MKLTRRSFLTRAGLCAAATICNIATSKHRGAPDATHASAPETIQAKSGLDKASSLSGMRTGFAQLDRVLGNLHGGSLILLGAAPALGKTSFAANIATRMAQQGMPIMFFSLESSADWLCRRILAMETMDLQMLADGKMNPQGWRQLAESLSDLPLWIDDTPAVTVHDIRASTIRHFKKYGHGKGAIIIDYVQLIQPWVASAESRRIANAEEVFRGLKTLANELDIPCIVLSQVSRRVRRRPDRRPIISDIREIGQSAQDADVVLFLCDNGQFENWKYNPEVEIELIVAKNHLGVSGRSIPFLFQRNIGRFEELEA